MANDTPVMPDTKQFRVTALGARYAAPSESYDANGRPVIAFGTRLATRGDKIDLVEREARRLEGLGVIAEVDAPLTYDEMTEGQLSAETSKRGLSVRGSAADGSALREDHINALINADAGAFVAASEPGGVAVATNPDPSLESGSGGQVPQAQASASGEFDIASLSEQIKSGGDGGKALNVDETVALAGDDPQAAQAVLEAEQTASGGDPRSTVESRLRAIIDRG